MGNAQLQVIAAELVRTIRERPPVDCWRRDNVRAAMRRDVRRLLRKYGFPPDLQDDAVRLVIQQAEALAQGMARGVADLTERVGCGIRSTPGIFANFAAGRMLIDAAFSIG